MAELLMAILIATGVVVVSGFVGAMAALLVVKIYMDE